MPTAAPVMHFAENDNELSPGINSQHEVPSNFWPQQEAILLNVTNDNIKELVRMGYIPPSLCHPPSIFSCFKIFHPLLTSECRHKRRHVTLHLMRYSPRAMIPKMKIRLGKLNHISDYVITFMVYPEREDIGTSLPSLSSYCVMLNLF